MTMQLPIVVGPYVFGVGLVSFLLSKELWLYEHQFSAFVAFWLAIYVLAKKFGAPTRKFVDDFTAVSDWYAVFLWGRELVFTGSK